MAVVKRFKVDIVSSPTDTTPFFDLGYAFFYVVKFLRAVTRLAYDPMGAGTTPWDGAVDAPGYVGATGTVSGITSASSAAGIAQLPYYTAGAPKTTVKSLDNPSFVGKYIRLENIESGYYMVSDGTIQADGSLTNQNYNCYNDSGTRMVQWGQSFGPTPLFTQNNNRRFTLACEFLEDGETIKKRGNGAAINVCSMQYWAETTMYYYTETITASTSQANWDAYIDWLNGVSNFDMKEPYPGIDASEPSGPAESEGFPEDELVPVPDLPSVSVTDTGFVTLFNPTLAQVKALAAYMWAGLFDINTFKKIFADPMDCILGFNMLPVAIPDGGLAEVVVGNIGTGVTMQKAAAQWVELDCGTLTIPKSLGNYLDYSPYTKYSIYLPYIGTVDLSTDDIMGHTVHLVYHVDVLSCSCVAYLDVDGRVMYQWTGSCGYSIPVTGNDFRQMISNIVSIAATLGGAMVTGGMSAPMAAAAAAAGAATATNNVLNSKPDVHRSGSIGSSAGMMGMQRPYLIQQGPKICKPEKQYKYLGYPAFVTVTLGSVYGYQEFSNIILDGIPCTEEERDMIAAACAGGIYL